MGESTNNLITYIKLLGKELGTVLFVIFDIIGIALYLFFPEFLLPPILAWLAAIVALFFAGYKVYSKLLLASEFNSVEGELASEQLTADNSLTIVETAPETISEADLAIELVEGNSYQFSLKVDDLTEEVLPASLVVNTRVRNTSERPITLLGLYCGLDLELRNAGLESEQRNPLLPVLWGQLSPVLNDGLELPLVLQVEQHMTVEFNRAINFNSFTNDLSPVQLAYRLFQLKQTNHEIPVRISAEVTTATMKGIAFVRQDFTISTRPLKDAIVKHWEDFKFDELVRIARNGQYSD